MRVEEGRPKELREDPTYSSARNASCAELGQEALPRHGVRTAKADGLELCFGLCQELLDEL